MKSIFKDKGRTGFEAYYSAGLVGVLLLLWILLHLTMGGWQDFATISLSFGIFVIMGFLLLLFRRQDIVRTWYKKEFRKQRWYWIWGFVILLVYIGLTWIVSYGLFLLFDLYKANVAN